MSNKIQRYGFGAVDLKAHENDEGGFVLYSDYLAAINAQPDPVKPKQVGGPCSVCGTATILACSDCRIDTGGMVYVCSRRICREEHDKVCTRKPVVLSRYPGN
jgi:hypothetical protein